MVISKCAVAAATAVARVDGFPVVLLPDGKIVAVARRAAIVVYPTPPDVARKLPLPSTAGPTDAVGVSVEGAMEIVRLIGRDNMFGGLLEHAAVSQQGGVLRVQCKDGKRPAKSLDVRVLPPVPQWDRAATIPAARSVLVNRKRLLALLSGLDAAAASTDEAPLWLDITDSAVVLRTVDTRTGQEMRALCAAAKAATPTKMRCVRKKASA